MDFLPIGMAEQLPFKDRGGKNKRMYEQKIWLQVLWVQTEHPQCDACTLSALLLESTSTALLEGHRS